MINIYITGKVKKREFIKYKNINYMEPYNYAKGLNILDENIYASIDLTLLNKADLIILVLDSNEVRNSLFEIGYCFAKNKPIIILDLMKDSTKYNFTKQFASSIFRNFQELNDFIGRLSND